MVDILEEIDCQSRRRYLEEEIRYCDSGVGCFEGNRRAVPRKKVTRIVGYNSTECEAGNPPSRDVSSEGRLACDLVSARQALARSVKVEIAHY